MRKDTPVVKSRAWGNIGGQMGRDFGASVERSGHSWRVWCWNMVGLDDQE